MIQKQHSELIEKLKKIQEKIGIMLSKQGGKNKEIQDLINSFRLPKGYGEKNSQ